VAYKPAASQTEKPWAPEAQILMGHASGQQAVAQALGCNALGTDTQPHRHGRLRIIVLELGQGPDLALLSGTNEKTVGTCGISGEAPSDRTRM
jgi:hypothetical protein